MSLVNEVLTDLQARRAAVSTPLYGLHAAPDGSVVARPAPRWRWPMIAALLAATALAAWLHFARDPAAAPVARSAAGTGGDGAAMTAPMAGRNAVEVAPKPAASALRSTSPGALVIDPADAQRDPPPVRRFALQVATSLARPPSAPPQRRPAQRSRAPAPAVRATTTADKPAEPLPASPAAVARTPVAGHERLRRDGLAALRAGDPGIAEDLFRRLVVLQPGQAEPYLLLHACLQAQARPAAARSVLADALDKVDDSAPVAAVLARGLLADERSAEAAAILEAHRPAAHDDLQYESLLAAALQRAGRHAAAAEVYAGLVARRPDNGAWWVGLGISQETLGEMSAARESFAAASRSPTLDAALADYVKRRLQRLEKSS